MAKKCMGMGCSSGGGGVYCLGLIGALVYYLQQAGNFTEGVVGVLKAFVWPAFFVYKIFEYLGL